MSNQLKIENIIFPAKSLVFLIFFHLVALTVILSTPEEAFSEKCRGLYDVGCQERIRDQLMRESQQKGRNSGGGNQTIERWYAFCNRTGANYNNRDGGRIVLGKRNPNINTHFQMYGPVGSEPQARSWVTSACPSWRCDWNGRCLNVSTGGGGSTPCPPGTYRDLGVFGQGSGECISK